MAEIASLGMAGNARAVVAFGAPTFGDLSLSDCVDVLKASAKGLNEGDMTAAIDLLAAQAFALNGMFGELARRAHLNLGHSLDISDRYMRLALKAQSQCRATLETLAAIKNPPVVFARQANINNGGQQQINNGAEPPHAANPARTCASARPGESDSGPNELLEDRTHGRTQMDTRT